MQRAFYRLENLFVKLSQLFLNDLHPVGESFSFPALPDQHKAE